MNLLKKLDEANTAHTANTANTVKFASQPLEDLLIILYRVRIAQKGEMITLSRHQLDFICNILEAEVNTNAIT